MSQNYNDLHKVQKQKQVHLTWHAHGEDKGVYQADRNYNLFILN